MTFSAASRVGFSTVVCCSWRPLPDGPVRGATPLPLVWLGALFAHPEEFSVTVALDLQDQPQIERIRERLWGERKFGRAAIMVGSRFSRNATTVSPGVARFPLWRDTAERMLDDLHPASGLDEESRSRRRAPYGTAFGVMKIRWA